MVSVIGTSRKEPRKDSGYAFVSVLGVCYTSETSARSSTSWPEHAKVPHIRFHGTRHSYGTLLHLQCANHSSSGRCAIALSGQPTLKRDRFKLVLLEVPWLKDVDSPPGTSGRGRHDVGHDEQGHAAFVLSRMPNFVSRKEH